MKFKDPQLGQILPNYWIVVPPKIGYSFSERIEIHIATEQAVIVLIDDEAIRIDFSNPEDDSVNHIAQYLRTGKDIFMDVQKIAQSPDGSKFAYLDSNLTLYIGQQDYFEKTLIKRQVNKAKFKIDFKDIR